VKISSLPVSNELKSYYEARGITLLYPPQADCVKKGLFEGKNLLISIPTASGKTLVAEMAMHYQIAKGGKCLYIVPLKALASEKYDEFSKKGVNIGISTGDLDQKDEYLGKNDIIVATSEKVDSLLRNNTSWINEVSLLVVDEIHLIDSDSRGATLELVITKIRTKTPNLQIIGLSATIGNPEMLAGWLSAELVTSTWRPVDLRQGVFFLDRIYFKDSEKKILQTSKHDDLNLCLDTIREGGQCLVFVSSRRNAEAFAKRAASSLKLNTEEARAAAAMLKAIAVTDQGNTLADCVAYGSAFHHAGLQRKERKIIEQAFRKGIIKVISSTPTLAAGLNLPARRVIIRDYLRFTSGQGMLPIPVSEYHQMAGRAGRPHLDPYGEAILLAKDREGLSALKEWYIDSDPEKIHSQCAQEQALSSHILSLFASGFVNSREELLEFMKGTFYQHENKEARLLIKTIDKVLALLLSYEMIVSIGNDIAPTDYGSLVSQLYVTPRTAETIVYALRNADEYSDIGLLETICSTYDMPRLFANQKDLHIILKFIQEKNKDFWSSFDYSEEDEEVFRIIKTAAVLDFWLRETEEKNICEYFNIGPGDIYNLVESMTWLVHGALRLSRMFRIDFSRKLGEIELCMKYGCSRELIPLVRIHNIGRVRARKLYNHGIKDEQAIKKAGKETLVNIIGKGVGEDIWSTIEDKAGYDSQKRRLIKKDRINKEPKQTELL